MKKSYHILFYWGLLLGMNINSQNLYIDSGGSIFASSEARVTVENNLKVDSLGSFVIKNATLKVGGEDNEGTIKYIKTLEKNSNWQTFASPVKGQNVQKFAERIYLDSGENSGENNMGLQRYNTTSDNWEFYQRSSNDWGEFPIGEAYFIKLRDIDNSKDDESTFYDISFEGSIPNTSVEFNVQNNVVDGSQNRYRFIGNPYISYIDTNAELNSLMKHNDEAMHENKTLYFFDTAEWTFTETNYGTDLKTIGPGDAFFVEIKDDKKFIFPKNIIKHERKSQHKSKNSTKKTIHLRVTDNTTGSYKRTRIFYTDGASKGNDPGYDSKMFYNGENYFGIYTHLLKDNLGDDYGVQSLPQNDYEKMIIPIGINATTGTNITISTSIINLPAGISVYLEDKETGIFTELNEESTFTTTLSSDLNGVGRFYLYTTSQVLDLIDTPILNENISIYMTSVKNLRIVGVQNEQATLRVYNILGKKILNTHFIGNGLNDIALPLNITSGIYIVQLTTSTKKLNKKINIE
jgi:hypothetical protein